MPASMLFYIYKDFIVRKVCSSPASWNKMVLVSLLFLAHLDSLIRNVDIFLVGKELNLGAAHLADRIAFFLSVGVVIGKIVSSEDEELLALGNGLALFVYLLNKGRGIGELVDVSHKEQIGVKVVRNIQKSFHLGMDKTRTSRAVKSIDGVTLIANIKEVPAGIVEIRDFEPPTDDFDRIDSRCLEDASLVVSKIQAKQHSSFSQWLKEVYDEVNLLLRVQVLHINRVADRLTQSSFHIVAHSENIDALFEAVSKHSLGSVNIATRMSIV